jgi:hypothetical protein
MRLKQTSGGILNRTEQWNPANGCNEADPTVYMDLKTTGLTLDVAADRTDRAANLSYAFLAFAQRARWAAAIFALAAALKGARLFREEAATPFVDGRPAPFGVEVPESNCLAC